jgi:23S rRNA pseudouridine2604 synthase
MAKRTKKLTSQGDENEEIRINKFLSESGVCSRREADRYITEGKVKIDGKIAEMGSKVTKDSVVTFLDKPIKREEKLVLIAFNKPEGIVCTTDQREPDNIIDFIKYGMRIYPIGRLDKDSEGLILLTNDGNIVNKILRAENQHEKEYIVRVNKEITAEFIQGMSSGVPILDTVTSPCKVTQLDKYSFNIILTQGLNRQIRRMCEYFDYRVVELTRIRIMNIQLGRLKTGDYRNVTEKEIEELGQAFQEQKEQRIDKSRNEKIDHDKTKYKKVNHDKVKHEKDKYDKTKRDKLKHDEVKNEKAKYDKTTQNNKTKYDKTQNEKAKFDKTQNEKAKFDKTTHNKAKHDENKYNETKYDDNKPSKDEHDKSKHDIAKNAKSGHIKSKYAKFENAQGKYKKSKKGNNQSKKREEVKTGGSKRESDKIRVISSDMKARASQSKTENSNQPKEHMDSRKVEFKGKKNETVRFSKDDKRRSPNGYSEKGYRPSSSKRSKFR